ncbi:MAG: helix-turn-helix domain-containing protein [Solobacterium sp.]|nr:helix-turn-helix domain-containing protein [Solobacterium sp.]
MKRNIAYPNEAQAVLLQKTFGCARFIWNKEIITQR